MGATNDVFTAMLSMYEAMVQLFAYFFHVVKEQLPATRLELVTIRV